jgi:hypothetical protein
MGGPVPLGYVAKDKKLVVIPDEAEAVRLIFRRYLELGAIGPLLQDLDAKGVITKRRQLSSGRSVGGGRFGKGALNHFLRNRCYIGEIEHRGKIFAGAHEPILDRELFEAVQAKLVSNAVARKLTLKSSPAVLTGKIYDDRGNRMGPSHSQKKGIRYRYYVSKAVLQRRPAEAGSVPRVPAQEIESLVADALQSSCPSEEDGAPLSTLEKVVVKRGLLEVHLYDRDSEDGAAAKILAVEWSPPNGRAAKGLIKPHGNREKKAPANREALLTAIAKARVWMEELIDNRVTITELAEREGKGERYIRLLLPLAFTAPLKVQAIADPHYPQRDSLNALVRSPSKWSDQSALKGDTA